MQRMYIEIETVNNLLTNTSENICFSIGKSISSATSDSFFCI
jgi:hypothetical protein